MLSPNFWPLLLYPGSLSGHGCLPLHPCPASGTPRIGGRSCLGLAPPPGPGVPPEENGGAAPALASAPMAPHPAPLAAGPRLLPGALHLRQSRGEAELRWAAGRAQAELAARPDGPRALPEPRQEGELGGQRCGGRRPGLAAQKQRQVRAGPLRGAGPSLRAAGRRAALLCGPGTVWDVAGLGLWIWVGVGRGGSDPQTASGRGPSWSGFGARTWPGGAERRAWQRSPRGAWVGSE